MIKEKYENITEVVNELPEDDFEVKEKFPWEEVIGDFRIETLIGWDPDFRIVFRVITELREYTYVGVEVRRILIKKDVVNSAEVWDRIGECIRNRKFY